MSNFNQTSAEDKNCMKVLGIILEKMTSACAGGNESKVLLCEGDDVIIGGGDCELEICGDGIDWVGVPGTTSKEVPDKIERQGAIKEGKAGHEINGGGDSGNNVVEKVVIEVMDILMAEMM